MTDETPSWLLGGGGLVVLGGGFKWLWDKLASARTSRERKIENREHEYVAKMEARIALIEQKLTDQGAELTNHRIALTLLIAEVERIDPGAVVLRQVKKILGASFPLQVDIPADMRATLDTLHGGDSK